MNQYDKIYGGLVGIAYGDAFGMPSEMWTRNEISKYFGKIDDFLPGPPENVISNQLVRGEVTDDTMNTILVVEMLAVSCKAALLGSKKGKEVCSPSVERRIRFAWELTKKQMIIGKTEEEVLTDIYELVGTGLLIVESVPAALALVYLAKGNPRVCARYCANIGGDTDTIGAMACGICGVLEGRKGFLQDEIQLLERVNHISFERLSKILYSLI